MNVNQLIAALQNLTPEERELPVVHTHTEYVDGEDSVGCEIVTDIDTVHVRTLNKDKYGMVKGRKVIVVGY